MAESFVNTFWRDYESRMDLSDAPTVLAQLADAFEHFNEIHPHSSLKMKSPRQFRRQRDEQMRRAQLQQPALRRTIFRKVPIRTRSMRGSNRRCSKSMLDTTCLP